MRKGIATLLVALVVPGAALAAKPTPAPGKSGTAKAPQVVYLLKGKLTAYSAANGSTPGSVSLLVSASNYHAKALKTKTLTFAVSSSTKVTMHDGAVTVNDKGIVKVRAAKTFPAGSDLATELQKATARQVVDQGASK